MRSTVETGKEREMLAALSTFRDERLREIRDLCDRNYQEFVRSIDELLDVRSDTMALKDEIVDINKQLQDGGKQIVTLTEQLVQHKRTLRNLRLLGTLLGSCKQFWLLVDRANRDTRDGRYYEALRAIVDLERALRSPLRLRELEFGRYVAGALPLMRERVREGAVYALNQWLETVRRRAVEIGKLAVDRTERRADFERRRLSIRTTDNSVTSIDNDNNVATTNKYNNSNNSNNNNNDDDDDDKRSKASGSKKRSAASVVGGDAQPIEPPLFATLSLDFGALHQWYVA